MQSKLSHFGALWTGIISKISINIILFFLPSPLKGRGWLVNYFINSIIYCANTETTKHNVISIAVTDAITISTVLNFGVFDQNIALTIKKIVPKIVNKKYHITIYLYPLQDGYLLS